MTVVINEMDVVAPEQDGQAEAAAQPQAAESGGRRSIRTWEEAERAFRVRSARARRLRAY